MFLFYMQSYTNIFSPTIVNTSNYHKIQTHETHHSLYKVFSIWNDKKNYQNTGVVTIRESWQHYFDTKPGLHYFLR
jgi:hypothetical protein